MALQCDPTVIYALQRAGTLHGNLRRDDLAFDSPYNTYRYPGLPPGPIASPGTASLEAAVASGRRRLSCTSSAATTARTSSRTTLAEHNRNVQKYQVEYFTAAEGRQGRRGQAERGGSGSRALSARPT